MPLVEVLLGLISVMVAVVLTVVGALYRELILNIKPTVQDIKTTNYGHPNDDTDTGLVDDVQELDTKLQEAKQQRQSEHETVETRLDRLADRLDAVISALRHNDQVEITVENESQNGKNRP